MGAVEATNEHAPLVAADTAPGGSCTATSMNYHGGRILDHVKIKNIFWGSYWNTTGSVLRSQIDTAWQVIGNNRTFYGALAQYPALFQTPGPGTYLGALTVGSDPGANVSDADVQAFIKLMIFLHAVPSNTDQNLLYVVYLPNGTISHPDLEKMWNGHHDRFVNSDNNQIADYATITSLSTLDQYTRTASHEVDEAIAAGAPAGGSSFAWDEVGDPCQFAPYAGFRFNGYLLERVWSKQDCGCVTTIAQPFASKHDLIWRDTRTNDVNLAKLEGGRSVLDRLLIKRAMPAEWVLAGTGDFDGDGEGDLLWHDEMTGQVAVWLMRANVMLHGDGVHNMQTVAGAQIAGVGDFDGDGLSDVLWRNPSTGLVTIAYTGARFTPGTPSFAAGTDWQIAGIADFDGDRKADILWRNVTGRMAGLWLVKDGPSGTSITYPTAWSGIDWGQLVGGVGDFDGDGKADILWRDLNTNNIYIWLLNGGAIRSAQTVATGITFDWSILAAADLDGDGKTDLLWRQAPSGATGTWLMNGSAIRSMSSLDTSPDESLLAGTLADQTF